MFENNGDLLWANVRRTVEDFLFNEWRSNRLFGTKPEQAYFVRCDRTTMTQNDIDDGRLICLIGVSHLRPEPARTATRSRRIPLSISFVATFTGRRKTA